MIHLESYDLFLFDLDGLLVNTEELHFKAYQRLCLAHGAELPWDFVGYSKKALFSSTALREALEAELPLFRNHPWEALYQQKKRFYMALLASEGVELMPGAERLLRWLEGQGKRRSLVTHSPREQVEAIALQLPALRLLPQWITREDYGQPKPHPESYLKAIERLGHPSDRIIGFEDSPRGLQALLGAGAEGCLISSHLQKEEIKPLVSREFALYPSLEVLLDSELP